MSKLGIGIRPFDEADRLTDVFTSCGVISQDQTLGADGLQGFPNHRIAKGLRGLYGPEAGAIQMPDDPLSGRIGFFDRIDHWRSGYCGPCLLGGCEGFVDQFLGQARTSSVVNENQLSLRRKGLQAIPDGVLAFRPAGSKDKGLRKFIQSGYGAKSVFQLRSDH